MQDLAALVSREPRERPSSMHPDVVLALNGNDKNPNAISRRGGSRLAPRVIPKRVVVDVREFMSSLPSILYQQGLELVPITLEVRTDRNVMPKTPCKPCLQCIQIHQKAQTLARIAPVLQTLLRNKSSIHCFFAGCRRIAS